MNIDEMLEFRKNALQGVLTNPLCADYRNEWRRCGDEKDKLVRMVMRQQSLPYFITHCDKGKGLSKQYILDNFGDYINGKRPILDADDVKGYSYGLYVAFDGVFKAVDDVLAFMWCNSPHVEIPKTKCPVFYCGCNTEMHLVCDGYNSPKVYLFDNSKLIIDDADDSSQIVVYSYSDTADVEGGKYCTTKNIKLFRKELRL